MDNLKNDQYYASKANENIKAIQRKRIILVKESHIAKNQARDGLGIFYFWWILEESTNDIFTSGASIFHITEWNNFTSVECILCAL